jgi:hypothetical protein
MHGDVSGVQDFRAVTSDAEVIDMVRAELLLSENDRHLFIIGSIDRGDGGPYLPWNWHFVPDQWTLTELIELCDGNAELVNGGHRLLGRHREAVLSTGSYAAQEEL